MSSSYRILTPASAIISAQREKRERVRSRDGRFHALSASPSGPLQLLAALKFARFPPGVKTIACLESEISISSRSFTALRRLRSCFRRAFAQVINNKFRSNEAEAHR
jgi:hypothetical protein